MASDSRPTVVCLCGSTRFREAFERVACEETLAGRIVLTVNDFDTARKQPVGHEPPTAEKAMLDELHLRKIDLADEVLILNVGGYVGESTRRELIYAMAHGKRVRWLEDYCDESGWWWWSGLRWSGLRVGKDSDDGK